MSNLLSNRTISKSELADLLEVSLSTVRRRMHREVTAYDDEGREIRLPLYQKILGLSYDEYRRTKRFTPMHTSNLLSHFVVTND
ncbi:MAG: hypothetical protein ACPG5B_06835 [Chitinophagales bacterium]